MQTNSDARVAAFLIESVLVERVPCAAPAVLWVSCAVQACVKAPLRLGCGARVYGPTVLVCQRFWGAGTGEWWW